MSINNSVALAKLALYAYDYLQRPDNNVYNRTGIPEGWDQHGIAYRRDSTGFLGHAFVSSDKSRLVVSFAGTRFDPDQTSPEPDWITNFNGAQGLASPAQFANAMDFFQQLMADPSIPELAKQNVTFTGHSLGGGMAGLMGVLFDVPSLGFASAPFQFKSMRPDALVSLARPDAVGLMHFDSLHTVTSIANSSSLSPPEKFRDIQTIIQAREWQAELIAIEDDAITWYLQNVGQLPQWLTEVYTAATLAIGGQKAIAEYMAQQIGGWIRSIFVDTRAEQSDLGDADWEEILDPRTIYIGDQNLQKIYVGESEMSLLDRHSMAWHMLLMDQEDLLVQVSSIPKLAPIMTGLFGSNAYSPQEQVLLNKLINNHYGVRDATGNYVVNANGWLDSYLDEIQKISGLAGTDVDTKHVAGLIAAVSYFYWLLPHNTATVPEFFVQHDWGLTLDLSAIDDSPGEDGGQPPVSDVVSRGGYLWDLLDNDFRAMQRDSVSSVSAAVLDISQPVGSSALWHVQLGERGADHDGDSSNEVFLGGESVSDRMNGADGNDLISSLSGNDTLQGGKGNDTLFGGVGSDRYEFQSGDGKDVIYDRDGNGGLIVNEKDIQSAEVILSLDGLRTWIDRDNDLILKYKPGFQTPHTGTLLITGPGLGGEGNQIEIRNYRMASDFSSGDLNLTFDNKTRLAILQGSVARNPFLDPAFDETALDNTADLQEGAGQWLTLCLNTPSTEDRVITLSAQGHSDFRLMVNGDIITFTGSIDITLHAGQTNQRVGIHHIGDVDADTAVTFTARHVPEDGGETAEAQIEFTILADVEPDTTSNPVYSVPYVENEDGSVRGGILDQLQSTVPVYLEGNGGRDLLVGGMSFDVIVGSGSDMSVDGLSREELFGGGGDDIIHAEQVSDPAIARLSQFAGTLDTGVLASGNDGNDTLLGGIGEDFLWGGAGSDEIIGGGGRDVLFGDLFVNPQINVLDANPEAPVLRAGFANATWGFSSAELSWNTLRGETVNRSALALDFHIANGGWNASAAGAADRLYGNGSDDRILAGEGDDMADGGEGDDFIYAGSGNDMVLGGAGNDVLHGGKANFLYGGVALGEEYDGSDDTGADFIDGGDGHDQLRGGGGDDVLLGGSGDDDLRGDTTLELAGNDVLDGEAGMDLLIGGGGNDLLLGGEDNDQLHGDVNDPNANVAGHDTLFGEAGDDLLNGEGGNDALFGGEGKDTLDAGDGNDYLDGGAGNDQLQAGAGTDTLDGGAGNDVLFGDVDGARTPEGQPVEIDHEAGDADELDGGDGNDSLYGQGGNDVLDGGEGNDQIAGDAGADTIYGGAGNDVLFGDNTETNVALENHGADFIDAGDGDDSVQAGGGDDVVYLGSGNDTAAGGDGSDFIVGGTGNDQIHGDLAATQNAGNDTLYGDEGNDSLVAYAGNDEVDGGTGNDVLFGMEGDDTLRGGEGNDSLVGGEGADYMDGGAGNDRYDVQRSTGSLTGVFGADTIVDSGGEDVLVFGEGISMDDLLFANGSLRIYTADGSVDVHIENFDPADAQNPVIEYLGFADTGMVVSTAWLLEQRGLRVEGDGFVIGSSVKDSIFAGAGDDFVVADAGNDTVQAGAGDDIVLAGEGNDRVFGGAGDDLVFGDAGNDTLDGGSGTDTLDGGEGNDVYVLSAGSGLKFIADAGGTDTLQLGAGLLRDNIRFLYDGTHLRIDFGGEDAVVLQNFSPDPAQPQAIDKIHFAASTVPTPLQFLIEYHGLTMVGDGQLTGTALRDNLLGGNNADVITALDGNDLVHAGSGNDTVHGGDGYDTIFGDAGDDVIHGDRGRDKLYGGEGNDVLYAGPNWNWNTLDGGAGDDTMYGGTGPDLFVVDSLGDVLVWGLGEFDWVHSWIDYVAPWHVSSLTLLGDAIRGEASHLGAAIMGNAHDNVLLGNAAADRLLGGDGNDTLDGGASNDKLFGEAGDDTLVIGESYFRAEESSGSLTGIGELYDGGEGSDTYVMQAARFNAHLNETDSATDTDVLLLPDGFSLADLAFEFDGENLAVHLLDAQGNRINALHVHAAAHAVEMFRLADGTTLTLADMLARATPVSELGYVFYGTDANEKLTSPDAYSMLGGAGNDELVSTHTGSSTLSGGEGNDVLRALLGSHLMQGGAGNDLISGSINADMAFSTTMIGGAGSDTFEGGSGDDVFVVQADDSATDHSMDVIREGGDYATPGGQDTLRLVGGFDSLNLTVAEGGDEDTVLFTRLGDEARTVVAVAGRANPETAIEQFVVGDDGVAYSHAEIQAIRNSSAAPVSTDDSAAVIEDAVLVAQGNVLANDVDTAASSGLAVFGSAAAAAAGGYVGIGENQGLYGVLILAVDGSYQYTLNNAQEEVQYLFAGDVLEENFVYRLRNHVALGSRVAEGTLRIAIHGTDDAVMARRDAALLVAGTGSVVSGNVLANDAGLTQVNTAGVQAGQFGELEVTADGEYTYRLSAAGEQVLQALAEGETREESFAYTGSDGNETSSNSLKVTLRGVNDAPVAPNGNLQFSITAFAPLLLPAFVDPDAGDVLSLDVSTQDGNGLPDWLWFDSENRALQQVSAAPSADPVLLVYTATDASGASASVQVAVTPSDGMPPVGEADYLFIDGRVSNSVSINLLANDSDPDGDALATYADTFTTDFGVLAVGENGEAVFTVHDDFEAYRNLSAGETAYTQAFYFMYEVSDLGYGNWIPVDIEVVGRNDAPVFERPVRDSVVAPGGWLSIPELSGFGIWRDPDVYDGHTMTVTRQDGSPLPQWINTSIEGHSAWYIAGQVPEDAEGVIPVRMTITDSHGASAVSEFRIIFSNDPSQPFAQNDDLFVDTRSVLTGSTNLLDNDTNANAAAVLTVNADVVETLHGTLTISENGVATFAINEQAQAWRALGAYQQVSFTYQYTLGDDGSNGLTDTATLTVGFDGLNDAPEVQEEIPVLAGRSGEAFTYRIADNAFVEIDNGDAYWIQVVQADGSVLPEWLMFDPVTKTVAGTPSVLDVGELRLHVIATDSFGATAVQEVTLSVAPADEPAMESRHAPVAQDDALLVSTLVSSPVSLLANDSDADAGDVLRVLETEQAGLYGTLRVDTDGTAIYRVADPDLLRTLGEGEQLTESFVYSVHDNSPLSLSASGSVVVTLVGSNDAPIAVDDVLVAGLVPGAVGVDLLANDSDPDAGDALSVQATTLQGVYGSLQIAANGSATYHLDTARPVWTALRGGQRVEDSFAYTVFDNAAVPLSDEGVLRVSVFGRNDAPLAASDEIVVTAFEGAAVDVLANDLDPEGDALTVNAGSVVGVLGTLAVQSDGTAFWAAHAGSSVVQRLAAGETAEEIFGYVVSDNGWPERSASGEVRVTVVGVNDAPIVALPISAQVASEDSAFNFTLPTSTFTDIDNNDVLTYSATLADGSALPSWLSFDAATQTFSGTPVNADVGALLVKITATDLAGASATTDFTLTIANTNDAPVAQGEFISVSEDSASFSVSTSDLLANDTDVDAGDMLAVHAVDAASSAGASVSFDGTFVTYAADSAFDTLAAGETATDTFGYTVADAAGAQSNAVVTVTLTGVNDAPVVAQTIAAQIANEDAAFSFTLPAGTFTDIDNNDVLTYAASLADGSALPLWLAFDAATQTFSGTPVNADVGALLVKVTATDLAGASATTDFTLTVANSNDAPVAQGESVSVSEDSAAFSLTTADLLANDSDVDAGDVLFVHAVSAASASGVAVSFEGGTVTYAAGNRFDSLAAGETWVDHVTYVVTDSAGATASTNVQVTILGVNDAPVLAMSIADQNAVAGAAVSIAIPSGTFTDVDASDLLTLSATLADGSALPSWLSFNGGVFSGTAPASAAALALRVTATDRAGAAAYATFTLTVTAEDNECHGLNLVGTYRNDSLVGSACDDVIDGGKGVDTMRGGKGNDVYYVDAACTTTGNHCGGSGHGHGNAGVGNGEDPPPPGHSHNFNDGPGTSPGNPGAAGGNGYGNHNKSKDYGDHDDHHHHSGNHHGGNQSGNNCRGDVIVELANEGHDTVYASVSYTLAANVEDLLLAGTANLNGGGNVLANFIAGNRGANRLDGAAGNDFLRGDLGRDTLTGGAGTDLLEGGIGDDNLSDTQGNALLNGGGACDTLQGGSGNELLLGGTHQDKIDTGGGADVMLFNRGDGCDIVTARGGRLTLSLGGGVRYEDLRLSRQCDDLILSAGWGDQLRFEDWYKRNTEKPALTLQVVAESLTDFVAGGGNALKNNRIETFDLSAVISRFDQQTRGRSYVSDWAVASSLTAFHLGGSDSEAMGGELAYRYGLAGSLAGLSAAGATALIGSSAFGSSGQGLASVGVAAPQERSLA